MEHGTFCLSGTKEMKPNVESLSVLQPKCGEWHEAPAFTKSVELAENGLQDVLKGLVDKSTQASIPDFLQQSERIFQELLVLLQRTKDSIKQKPAASHTAWTVEYAEELTKQLEELERDYGSDVVHDLSSDLSKVTLQYQDAAGRLHQLNIKLSPVSFPNGAPECMSELPMAWQPTNDTRDNSRPQKRFKVDPNNRESGDKEGDASRNCFLRLYGSFVQQVDKYQDFWNELDDLDANAWVLEPSTRPVPRSISERRIAITDEASVVIALDPNSPRARPTSVRWIGADTSKHRCGLDQYMTSQQSQLCWTSNSSVRENLERGLALKLPLPPCAGTGEALLECSICYSNDLPTEDGGSEFPDTVCDNLPCKRYYHETCLRDWLQSLPTSRKSFDRIIGTCPYCNEPISATIQQA